MAARPERAGRRALASNHFDDPATAQTSVALGRLQRLLAHRRVADRIVAASGVAMSQQSAEVLRVLRDGQARPVAHVARAAQMHLAAVSRQLGPLEELGLITRRPSPDHGSVVLVRSTAAGRRAALRSEQIRREHLRNVLSSWTDDDRDRFAELFTRFVDGLQHTPLPLGE